MRRSRVPTLRPHLVLLSVALHPAAQVDGLLGIRVGGTAPCVALRWSVPTSIRLGENVPAELTALSAAALDGELIVSGTAAPSPAASNGAQPKRYLVRVTRDGHARSFPLPPMARPLDAPIVFGVAPSALAMIWLDSTKSSGSTTRAGASLGLMTAKWRNGQWTVPRRVGVGDTLGWRLTTTPETGLQRGAVAIAARDGGEAAMRVLDLHDERLVEASVRQAQAPVYATLAGSASARVLITVHTRGAAEVAQHNALFIARTTTLGRAWKVEKMIWASSIGAAHYPQVLSIGGGATALVFAESRGSDFETKLVRILMLDSTDQVVRSDSLAFSGVTQDIRITAGRGHSMIIALQENGADEIPHVRTMTWSPQRGVSPVLSPFGDTPARGPFLARAADEQVVLFASRLTRLGQFPEFALQMLTASQTAECPRGLP